MSVDSILPVWSFPEHPKHLKRNENNNGEHFNTLDIEGRAQAFVREAIQNSVDGSADVDGTVRVRVYVSGDEAALDQSVWSRYFSAYGPHYSASAEQLRLDPDYFSRERCPFVVFEDFGTTGLTGDVRAFNEDGRDLEANHFFHFFRTTGRTSANSDRLGSWGIGKFVFLMASDVRSMFGYTIRLNAPESSKRLLMGQSTLRYHQVDGVDYVNDGWLAETEVGDSFPLPISNPAILDQFARDWKLVRQEEPGLSVVVPFCTSIESSELLRAVVSEFCGKLLEGRLEVEIETPEHAIEITAATLPNIIAQHRGESGWSEICRIHDLLTWYQQAADSDVIIVRPESGAWANGDWSSLGNLTEVKAQVLARMSESNTVVLRIPVSVRRNKKGALAEVSQFDVLLSRLDRGTSGFHPEYFRKWLRISGRKMGSRIAGFESAVIVSGGIIDQLLRDAEGPAHTAWTEGEKFRDQYVYGKQWLRFVKQAPKNLVSELLSVTPERDSMTLADYFPVMEGSTGDDDGSDGGKPKGPGETGMPRPPLSPVLHAIHLIQIQDGFSMAIPDPTSIRKFVTDIAFDVPRGNPFKKWNEADFIASDLDVKIEPLGAVKMVYLGEGDSNKTGEETRGRRNQIEFEIVDASQSVSIIVTGFGDNRDISVAISPEGLQ